MASLEETPAFQTPKTGIPEIDDRVKELQRDDAVRKAAAAQPKPLSPGTIVMKSTKRGAV